MTMTDTFRRLHESGTFTMPNPWDAGSARYLEWRGFPALATTSSGFAATLGRGDQSVDRDELLRHVEMLVAATSVPLNVDSEYCYADDLDGVAKTIALLAAAGAAGCSIEDYNPTTGEIDAPDRSIERAAAAAEAAVANDIVLTTRTERHLYGADDLDETIRLLVAFRDAGAEVLYAPGLTDLAQIERVVTEVSAPINVLAMADGPSVAQLEEIGVRRVSTGGALAWAALGGLATAVDELIDDGTCTTTSSTLSRQARGEVFS